MKPDRTDEVSKKETNSPLLSPKENSTLIALSVHTISTPAFQENKITKPQILIKQELSFPTRVSNRKLIRRLPLQTIDQFNHGCGYAKEREVTQRK
jgi:hypothetical protein